MLDYFWAGLPVIATRGDVLADLVEADGLGATAPAADDEALAGAMVSLLGDPPPSMQPLRAFAAMAPALRWSRVVEPLLDSWEAIRIRPAHSPFGRPAGRSGAPGSPREDSSSARRAWRARRVWRCGG